MMLSSKPNQPGQISANPAKTKPDSHAGLVRSLSPYTSIEDRDEDVVDASGELQQTTQKDIETVLYQLQKDLIEAVRMVPPPPDQICSPSSHGAGTEGSVESAIKRCVQSALERWTLESKTISSPPAEASASHIAGTSDYSPSSLHEAITQFPSTPSDIPSPPFQLSAPEASNPQLGSKRPVNHPLNALSGSADSTSPEPSSIRRKASIDTEPDEPASRVSRRSNKTDWEKFRPVLKRLYMKENLPLAEVIEIMKKNHHFSQTPKQYRYQLGEKWNWRKYNANTSYRSYPDRIKTTNHKCEGEGASAKQYQYQSTPGSYTLDPFRIASHEWDAGSASTTQHQDQFYPPALEMYCCPSPLKITNDECDRGVGSVLRPEDPYTPDSSFHITFDPTPTDPWLIPRPIEPPKPPSSCTTNDTGDALSRTERRILEEYTRPSP